ncbi:ring-cleaving dioxygenase [Secundilactobacillus kimchicus]|uniref:VOC family protein n=1 Tax=Secundilactobacillus kimchicus TaxID=528209 RepID=UPI001C0398A8|nr:VOC family protein [Secundilactobacillus kimchicus]MBT9672121.1 ring-cleaving dioxygenase [Secundilactobacillus kimchicus]
MANFQLTGIHHVTAMTSSAPKIYDFMTRILGLRLVKKTVNQDAIDTYHLYFTDDQGLPGTDLTFFDTKDVSWNVAGHHMISRISLRVPDDAAIEFWQQRFSDLEVTYGVPDRHFGALTLPFEDFDHQQYQLISDEHNHGLAGAYNKLGTLDEAVAIRGLGPVYVTMDDLGAIEPVLTTLMGFERVASSNNETLFELANNGHGAQLVVVADPAANLGSYGWGGVHHVAFRTPNHDTLMAWIEKIQQTDLPDSGYRNRYYFESEYFRPVPRVLFELATDEPGFFEDETYLDAGKKLELPPFLEAQRAAIERSLTPFDTAD